MRLENPVLARELIENLRSPKMFWLQALFVAALSTVVLAAWTPEVQLIEREEQSLRIYNTFALSQLVLLALAAPVLSAPAIASERERKSLDLLLTSPLKPRHIVWGKLLSAVVYLLLLAASSLPIFACCLFLGAAGPREIAATYLILFAAGFLCGAVGLAAGTFMGRVRGGLSVSYAVILPVVLVLMFANPMRNLPAAVTLGILAGGLGTLLVYLVQRRLRKPFDTAPRSADEEDPDEQIGLVLNRQRFPDNLLSPRGGDTPLDERINPVYQRELHHELFGRGTLLVRLLLQVSLVAALPFFIAALASGGLWVYSFYTLVFVMLIAPSLTAGIFTQERERGTFDLLLTTALSRSRVLGGKLSVNLRNIAILVGFLLPFFALFWILCGVTDNLYEIPQRHGWFFITAGTLAVILGTTLFVVLLTAFLSMICRTTLRSMVFTYLLICLFFALPLAINLVLTELAGVAPTQAHWSAVTSPFYTVALFEQAGLIARTPGVTGLHFGLYLAFTLGASALLGIGLHGGYNRYCRFRHDRGM